MCPVILSKLTTRTESFIFECAWVELQVKPREKVLSSRSQILGSSIGIGEACGEGSANTVVIIAAATSPGSSAATSFPF